MQAARTVAPEPDIRVVLVVTAELIGQSAGTGQGPGVLNFQDAQGGCFGCFRVITPVGIAESLSDKMPKWAQFRGPDHSTSASFQSDQISVITRSMSCSSIRQIQPSSSGA